MWKWKNDNRNKTLNRIYNKDFPPTRKLFLWGFDKQNNPSFLVLYGEQNFKQNSELEETVTYTESVVFKGNGGHFPSFEAVQVVKNYDYSTRQSKRKMHYKKDVQNYSYWCNAEEDTAIKGFRIFEEKEQVTIPYFDNIPYEEYVSRIQQKHLLWDDFRFAKNPSEVLKLPDELAEYTDAFVQLFTNPNIYTRKKILKELIDSKPTKTLYSYILSIGSSELISGLFLELGKRKDSILQKEAQEIKRNELNWAAESYAAGVKRCAKLYLITLQEKDRQKQAEKLRKTLYNFELSNSTEYESTKNSRKNLKSDLFLRNTNLFKNMLQTAELLQLPDVVAKMAYYLDTTIVYYKYFRYSQNSTTKAYHYFLRYARRIMDAFAKEDEEKFMEAIKILLTSYTHEDSASSYDGGYQCNYFVKHYLYCDLKQQQAFYNAIWNRHLEDVIEIVLNSNMNIITEAFFRILRTPENQKKLQSISIEKLCLLADSCYEPAANLFLELLTNKINSHNQFDINIMLQLMKGENNGVHALAVNYFQRTGGIFSGEQLAQIFLSDDINKWEDLFITALSAINEQEYIEFVKAVVKKMVTVLDLIVSEKIKTALNDSISKINVITNRKELLTVLLNELPNIKTVPDVLQEFIEQLIFMNSYEQLKEFLNKNSTIVLQNDMSGKNRMLFSFLQAIQADKIPTDTLIIEMLVEASSGMIKTFVNMVSLLKSQLHTRFTTLLIMMESDIAAFWEIVKAVFAALPIEEQKKLLAVLLDSSDEKTIAFSLQKLPEIYSSFHVSIPKEQLLPMLEHPSAKVRAFVSGKVEDVIANLGMGNKELFLYYVKTLLYLPNKVSFAKQNIYDALPSFMKQYPDVYLEVEKFLIDLGGSNIRLDAERALVALAKIKKEVVSIEG